MDFKLSKTHLLQQEMYRRFAENEVKPLAEEMDETEVFDLDLLAKMHKYGLMGIPYSKECGVGGDYQLCVCMEEISKKDGSAGITISVHTSCCLFLRYGRTEAVLRP
ncbi:MAG: acyl-CoA dehydrogenase family protein [Clostridia bacterium]